jgi:pyruvate/2-oxoglutarate dehydrogenase complex dihydrolipoamide acyltransferase (E2) component
MTVDVVMPQLGESVVEGVVTKWLVKEGDAVAKDQPIVEISTDKVDAEIPSPAEGVVSEILAKEGETVSINVAIARIDTDKEAAKKAPPPPEKPPEKWDEEEEGFPGAMARREAPPMPPPPREAPREAPPTPEAKPPAEPRMRVTPVVARMAAEHGIDLSKVRGTGEGGRVTKKDVEDYLARRAAPPPPPEERPAPPPRAETFGEEEAPGVVPTTPPEDAGRPAPPTPREAPPPPPAVPRPAVPPPEVPEEDRIIPFTPVRKRIAEHMVMSKRTSPHVHTFAEVDMHKVAASRRAMKEKGESLTFLPFVMWATVRAIREFPVMNASVEGDNIHIKGEIHIGLAVDTEKGLLVPVIRSAGRMSLLEMARAAEDVAQRTRTGKIKPDDLTGGTFSISNPGPKGNLVGTPIINQPQVGILRLGTVVKRPVVVEVEGEDTIAIRPVMHLCLGYDHRVIDGVTGNGFLFRIREILEAGEFGL